MRWVNFLDNYWCSDEGHFIRVYKNGFKRKLKPYIKKNNRLLVVKIHDKECNARRIVWEAFKGKIPDGYVIRSKGGFRSVCDLYSLECVPFTESCKWGGIAHRRYIKDKRSGRIYYGAREAAEALFISRQTVCAYCNNKIKKPAYDLEWYEEQ